MLPAGRLVLIAVALVAVGLSACGDDDEAATRAAAEGPQFEHPDQVLKRGEQATATVATSEGSFQIQLDTTGSPKTANSFAFLAEKGFYDGTTFHRIVPGFVVQGGDPTGTGTGGPGYSIDEPPDPATEYLRGVVAMANVPSVDPPGRSGSQFFVVVAADAGLSPQYALLGRVTSGMQTVSAIADQGDPASGQTGTPLEQVTIESVTIRRR
jgi:peptidyl-prolyl cis-trans isomerase B (cyclophilin B)